MQKIIISWCLEGFCSFVWCAKRWDARERTGIKCIGLIFTLLMSVSTIAPPQTVDRTKQKIMSIYRYRRPNWKTKCMVDLPLQQHPPEQVGPAKRKMRENRHGIGFETVAGMGGGFYHRRNTLIPYYARLKGGGRCRLFSAYNTSPTR